ncbi:MAG: radical SAM protein [Elusimicrobia bacterium]|nr:radical SAM protein [Elusimicrobiota bacterium]
MMASLAYLQLARVCDQKCLFCSNPANGGVMSLEEAFGWLARFKAEGYDGVVLTGGEPALHPGLERVVARCAEEGLAVRLITNGRRASEAGFLARLKAAGLAHLHVSVYSHRPEVAAALTGRGDALARAEAALREAARLGIRVDVNTVLCRQNADHLSGLAAWVVERHPAVGHMVFNNMDPDMAPPGGAEASRADFRDFELELARALTLLERAGRTFRVERVPLCFLPGFEHCATETRRLARGERRAVKFLDPRGLVVQKGLERYGKPARCLSCSLDALCAGVYGRGETYPLEQVCPVFVDARAVAGRARA